jgi:Oxyanion-translocating ATPase
VTSAALKLTGLYADKSFLLVSTDPAHSVQDSLHYEEDLPSNLKVLEFESTKKP